MTASAPDPQFDVAYPDAVGGTIVADGCVAAVPGVPLRTVRPTSTGYEPVYVRRGATTSAE